MVEKFKDGFQRPWRNGKSSIITMLGPDLQEQGGMGSVASLILKTPIPEIQIQYLSTWKAYPHSSKIGKIFYLANTFTQSLFHLLNQLIRGKVDLVHLHLSERGSALRIGILMVFARIFRKPIIIHAHGCEFHEFHQNLPTFAKNLLNFSLQQSTYLIALSKSWKNYYVEICGLKESQVLVLNNPVELPNAIPDRHRQYKLNLVFLGKINQRKGVYDLLHAIANLSKESLEKVHLILAGSGEVEKARSLARNLDIEQYISFAGWIDPQQRNHLLAQANIFILPSYNEGLPMALLEAMSWGVAVITTPVGGCGEVVIPDKTGLLVNPGDINSLTEKLQLLIENESLRLTLGQNAREFMMPLDIKKYSQSLAKIYKSAIDSPKYLVNT